MYATLLIRLCDLVTPLVLITRKNVNKNKFIRLHIRNSKHLGILLKLFNIKRSYYLHYIRLQSSLQFTLVWCVATVYLGLG